MCFQMLIIMSYPLLPCLERVNPGGIVTLNCTVPSLSHWWNVSSRDGGRSLTRADQDSVIQDPPFNFSVADAIPGSSITSTAVATVPVELNGTIVSCRDGFWVLPDPQSWVILVTGEEHSNGRHLTVISLLSMSTHRIGCSFYR